MMLFITEKEIATIIFAILLIVTVTLMIIGIIAIITSFILWLRDILKGEKTSKK